MDLSPVLHNPSNYLMTEADAEYVESLHADKRLAAEGNEYMPSRAQTVCEVGFMAHYGMRMRVRDVEYRPKSIQVCPTDLSGRKIRVVSAATWPFSIYNYRLDADLFVFVRAIAERSVSIFGWLPVADVEEAPIRWFEENGERTGYSHMVERGSLQEIPQKFDFESTCMHYARIWSIVAECWHCLGCSHLIYDANRRRKGNCYADNRTSSEGETSQAGD